MKTPFVLKECNDKAISDDVLIFDWNKYPTEIVYSD